MLVELTERERFLIHEFRNSENAKIARICYDLDVPMEESELQERIAWHKADILNGVDANKKAYLERCKCRGEPVNIKSLNAIQKEAERKALEIEQLYLSSNAKSAARMNVYIAAIGR